MKKAIILLASALVLSLSAKAEEFVPGWNLGIKGGAQYTAGEGAFNNLLSPTVSFDAGYQFTKTFGLRLDLNGWQAKGWMPLADQGYKYKYGQFALDATFNLIDMFSKTYKYHIVNPYIFVGFGGMYGYNNDEVKTIAKDKVPAETLVEPYKWDSKFSAVGRLGFGIDFKLCRRVAIALEVTDNAFTDKMNSKDGQYKPDFDYNISGLLGLKFTLGKAGSNCVSCATPNVTVANWNDGYPDYNKMSKDEAKAYEKDLKAKEVVFPCGWSKWTADQKNQWIRDNVYAEEIAAKKAAAEKAAKEAAEKAAREKAEREAAEKAAREKAAAEAAAAAKAAAKAAKAAQDAADQAADEEALKSRSWRTRNAAKLRIADRAERQSIEAEMEEALLSELVYFDLDKTEIRACEQQKINELAKVLKANADAKVKVTGYADRGTGYPAYNLELSKRRAQVVTDALIAEGIDAARITTLYKGDKVNPFPTAEENRVDVCIVK